MSKSKQELQQKKAELEKQVQERQQQQDQEVQTELEQASYGNTTKGGGDMPLPQPTQGEPEDVLYSNPGVVQPIPGHDIDPHSDLARERHEQGLTRTGKSRVAEAAKGVGGDHTIAPGGAVGAGSGPFDITGTQEQLKDPSGSVYLSSFQKPAPEAEDETGSEDQEEEPEEESEDETGSEDQEEEPEDEDVEPEAEESDEGEVTELEDEDVKPEDKEVPPAKGAQSPRWTPHFPDPFPEDKPPRS